MTTHRFFVDLNLNTNSITITDKALLNQWLKVLRFKVGDRFNLIDLTGKEVVVEVLNLTKTEANLATQTILPAKKVGRVVHLIVAILKKENFEFVVQKATEIGVSTIQPVITERTVKLGLNNDRLQKIITEASEQSGRQVRPYIHPVSTLKDYLTRDHGYPLISLSLNPEAIGKSELNSEKEVAILVGPEGGWSDEEEKLMKDRGVEFKSLGEQILRAETAAIVGSFAAVNNLI